MEQGKDRDDGRPHVRVSRVHQDNQNDRTKEAYESGTFRLLEDGAGDGADNDDEDANDDGGGDDGHHPLPLPPTHRS